MAKLSEETKQYLHERLIKCGDLLGNGDLDPGFEREVRKEYRGILKALGMLPPPKPRRNNSALINERMKERLKEISCPKCQGELKQVRAGSVKAICLTCSAKYALLKWQK